MMRENIFFCFDNREECIESTEEFQLEEQVNL